jgi:hypothetical protein
MNKRKVRAGGRRPAVALLCEDVDRGLRIHGRAASHILDPLGDHLEARGTPVFRVRSFNSKISCRNTYKINFDLRKIKRRAGRWYKVRNFVQKRVVDRTKTSRILNRYCYQKMIQVLRPAMILAVDPPPELCRAARDRGVKIANIAHGFGYPLECKVHGRLARAKIPLREEPHFFIAFDRVTQKTREKGDKGKDTRTLLGQRCNFPPRPPTRLGGLRQRRKKTVLVAMQWGYDGVAPELANILPDGIMAPALQKVIRTCPDVTWLIKWHPVQLRDPDCFRRVRNYIKTNLSTPANHVVDIDLDPIQDALAMSDLMITMCSMAVYEAAAQGVPSLALCPSLKKGGVYEKYFQDLEKEGILKKARMRAIDIRAAIFSRFASRRSKRRTLRAPELHLLVERLLIEDV